MWGMEQLNPVPATDPSAVQDESGPGRDQVCEGFGVGKRWGERVDSIKGEDQLVD